MAALMLSQTMYPHSNCFLSGILILRAGELARVDLGPSAISDLEDTEEEEEKWLRLELRIFPCSMGSEAPGEIVQYSASSRQYEGCTAP